MSTFALQLAAFAEKAGENANLVVRKVAIDLYAKVIERSPVGNPELWAANKTALSQRKNYNVAVDRLNAETRANPANQNKKGGLRKGAGKYLLKTASARALAKAYPLAAGKGYIGGQFKGNWQLAIGSKPSGTLETVDPQGTATIQAGTATMTAFEIGPSIWIVNNLPYGPRLEYEAWSKQAPAGMVRVSTAEFETLVGTAAKELPK